MSESWILCESKCYSISIWNIHARFQFLSFRPSQASESDAESNSVPFYVNQYVVCIQISVTSILKISVFTGIQQIYRKSHGVPAHWKSMRQITEENKNHMNFLPVPEGSWEEAYNKQNAKWNQMLGLSIFAVVATAGVVSLPVTLFELNHLFFSHVKKKSNYFTTF